MLTTFDLLTLGCKYTENGCEEKVKIHHSADDEKSCWCSKGKQEGPYNKMKPYDDYPKHGRRKDMLINWSDFCESHSEDAEDVLFSMLITTLTGKGKTELAKKVDYLWTAQTENALTIEPLSCKPHWYA